MIRELGKIKNINIIVNYVELRFFAGASPASGRF
jgi:hypothetical protein